MILEKMRADVDFILEPTEENKKRIYDAEKKILENNKPRSWNIYIHGNMEIEMEVEFEKYLLAVSEHTKESIDGMTVFRFNALVDYLKEKDKSNG
jgi:hypothetical protein